MMLDFLATSMVEGAFCDQPAFRGYLHRPYHAAPLQRGRGGFPDPFPWALPLVPGDRLHEREASIASVSALRGRKRLDRNLVSDVNSIC